MEPVIRIEHVSKRYRIGGLHPGYMTFREVLGGAVLAPFRRLRLAIRISRRSGPCVILISKSIRANSSVSSGTTAPANPHC
jgi:hypothetical protein